MKVTHVTFTDGAVEEMRGYSYDAVSEGVIVFMWTNTNTSIAIPLHNIRMMETEGIEE